MQSRIEMLQQMIARQPEDARAYFGLALEFEREARWQDVAETLRRYLALTDDEGNAYGRLGRALRELGQDDEARAAYQQGVDAAYRHGHPTLAMEFEEVLENWEG
jgi:tetratricopeptide (TPR) repeat protein